MDSPKGIYNFLHDLWKSLISMFYSVLHHNKVGHRVELALLIRLELLGCLHTSVKKPDLDRGQIFFRSRLNLCSRLRNSFRRFLRDRRTFCPRSQKSIRDLRPAFLRSCAERLYIFLVEVFIKMFGTKRWHIIIIFWIENRVNVSPWQWNNQTTTNIMRSTLSMRFNTSL
jgi:hypothetical protein